MGDLHVQMLGDGLWRWTVPHPEWNGATDWDEVVGSVYCETPGPIVVIDPQVPVATGDAERFWRAFDRDVARRAATVAVLLTCRWHVRSAAQFRTRCAARVYGPALAGHGFEGVVTDLVVDGAEVAPGVVALATGSPEPNEECVYVVRDARAVIVGDVLLGDVACGLRVANADWYANSDEERAWYRTGLAPALERILEYGPTMLLPAHGAPVLSGAGAALQQALSRHRASQSR